MRKSISKIRSAWFFFFNDTATTEIYTLSLHDALPICKEAKREAERYWLEVCRLAASLPTSNQRSEEHTSELQSQSNLVWRLLLEKKKSPDGLRRILRAGSTLCMILVCEGSQREASIPL